MQLRFALLSMFSLVSSVAAGTTRRTVLVPATWCADQQALTLTWSKADSANASMTFQNDAGHELGFFTFKECEIPVDAPEGCTYVSASGDESVDVGGDTFVNGPFDVSCHTIEDLGFRGCTYTPTVATIPCH